MNSLDDLALEYIHSAAQMSAMIEHGNALIRQAAAKHERRRVLELRARQQDLYAQRTYLRKTAAYLQNYYGHDPQKRNTLDIGW